MLKDFKEFALKGNVVDMSIGSLSVQHSGQS